MGLRIKKPKVMEAALTFYNPRLLPKFLPDNIFTSPEAIPQYHRLQCPHMCIFQISISWWQKYITSLVSKLKLFLFFENTYLSASLYASAAIQNPLPEAGTLSCIFLNRINRMTRFDPIFSLYPQINKVIDSVVL